jgi:hypothetical protein
MPIFYVSRDLAANLRTLYGELRRRFADLGVTESLKMNLQEQAERALGPRDAAAGEDDTATAAVRRRRLHTARLADLSALQVLATPSLGLSRAFALTFTA